jgi:hypothetical protein
MGIEIVWIGYRTSSTPYQQFFYYYLNKKIHYKTKLFHFFIKNSLILYHINHFLLLFKLIFYFTLTYQTG